MSEFNHIDRVRDLYRVHDTSKKQKKEEKRPDDREFKEFLEETEKEPEGYEEYYEEEETPQVPANSMLDMLGAGAAPFFKIEPIEEPAKEEKKKEDGRRGTDPEEDEKE